MIRRPPRSTQGVSSAASDVYKRQVYTQMPSYPEFLFNNGLINWFNYMSFRISVLVCRMTLKYHVMDDHEWNCALSLFSTYQRFGIPKDLYDITETISIYQVYEDFINSYLNKPSIQKALGVDRKFSSVNDTVYELMKGDLSLSLVPEVELALEKGVKVFLYFGDKDYVCNYLSGEYLADSLVWSGQTEFLKQLYADWKVDDIKLAEQRVYKNLALIKVLNAGHTIFFKQRKFALELLKNLLNEQ
eukprot:TRINITY_DN4043_c0_g1_i3.p1 TRINITY_DN4043_c0_g1~~TRINITY_DN4043_c0_g1_i3.p1  ORF type:complete len:245 (+),score=27.52 TRINITY_DN4043_c0_g1_i3:102-836(+)